MVIGKGRYAQHLHSPGLHWQLYVSIVSAYETKSAHKRQRGDVRLATATAGGTAALVNGGRSVLNTHDSQEKTSVLELQDQDEDDGDVRLRTTDMSKIRRLGKWVGWLCGCGGRVERTWQVWGDLSGSFLYLLPLTFAGHLRVCVFGRGLCGGGPYWPVGVD